MKPAYITEILLIFLSAIGGVILWNIQIHLVWRIIIGTLWFSSICSTLAGQLKLNAIEEYRTATQNHGEMQNG